MKKYLSLILLFLTGCASIHSQSGAIPNSILYEHRIPNKPVAQVVTDDKGLIKQIIPWGEISSNAPALGNSVANIVQAIKGNFGFPFGMIPDMVNTTLEKGQKFQKETSDQEVYKVYWVQGMNKLDVELPDKTKIKANLDNTNLVEEGHSDGKKITA